MLRVSRYGFGVAPTPPSLPLPLPLPLFLLVFRPSGFSLRLLCSFDTVIDVRALKLHPRQLHSSRLSSKLCRGRDSTTKKKRKKKKTFLFPALGVKSHCITVDGHRRWEDSFSITTSSSPRKERDEDKMQTEFKSSGQKGRNCTLTWLFYRVEEVGAAVELFRSQTEKPLNPDTENNNIFFS